MAMMRNDAADCELDGAMMVQEDAASDEGRMMGASFCKLLCRVTCSEFVHPECEHFQTGVCISVRSESDRSEIKLRFATVGFPLFFVTTSCTAGARVRSPRHTAATCPSTAWRTCCPCLRNHNERKPGAMATREPSSQRCSTRPTDPTDHLTTHVCPSWGRRAKSTLRREKSFAKIWDALLFNNLLRCSL